MSIIAWQQLRLQAGLVSWGQLHRTTTNQPRALIAEIVDHGQGNN